MWKKFLKWGGKAVSWSEENPEKVSSFWKRFKKKRDFLILGPGGVGKSTLAKYLAGDYNDPTQVPGDYVESLGLEEVDIPQLGATAIVPPGQEFRAEVFWDDLAKDIVKGNRFKGLILVYSFGFHSLAKSKTSHALYDAANDAEFLQAYTQKNRKLEQAFRLKIAELLRKRKKKIWVLEVVTKQDLWWDERPAAEAFYQPDMKDLVLEESAVLDSAKMFSASVLLSFKIDTFKSSADELLKSNVMGYTTVKQAKGLDELNRAIRALTEWEQK